jgi:hypothetical protein
MRSVGDECGRAPRARPRARGARPSARASASEAGGEGGVVLVELAVELLLGAGCRASLATRLAASSCSAIGEAGSDWAVGALLGPRRAPPPWRRRRRRRRAIRMGANRSPSAVTTTVAGVAASPPRRPPSKSSARHGATDQGVEQPPTSAERLRTCGRTGDSPTGAAPAGPAPRPPTREHGTARARVDERRTRAHDERRRAVDDHRRAGHHRVRPRPLDCQPASISTRSSSVPSTPSTRRGARRPRARERRRAPAGAPRPGRACATPARGGRVTGRAVSRRTPPRPRCAPASAASTSATSGARPPRPAAHSPSQAISASRPALRACRSDVVDLGGGGAASLSAALDAVADRPQLAAHLGRRAAAFAPPSSPANVSVEPLALEPEGLLVGSQRLGVGRQLLRGDRHLVQLAPEAGSVGLEVGDHPGVEQRAVVALERSLALGEDACGNPRARSRSCSTCTSRSLMSLAPRADSCGLERHDLGVEPGEPT